MLVLRRKIGQVICINDDIRIVIQDVQNEHIVRIGIDAPAEIPVHRMEIYQLIQQENKSASGAEALKWLQGVTQHDDGADDDCRINDNPIEGSRIDDGRIDDSPNGDEEHA